MDEKSRLVSSPRRRGLVLQLVMVLPSAEIVLLQALLFHHLLVLLQEERGSVQEYLGWPTLTPPVPAESDQEPEV